MSHGKRRRKFRGKIQVPVGFEKALFHAARDQEFRARLLADPRAAIGEVGIKLRSSELAMLASIAPEALEAMIDSLVPENPRRRKFMGLVAAAAASLAAGTVAASCSDDDDDNDDDSDTDTVDTDNQDTDLDGGAGPDTDVDSDSDSDSDSDTVDTDNPDTDVDGGSQADQDVDGEF